MKTLHIAVTGINASENPAPGIGIARSLKEQTEFDVKIAGLAYDAMEPGIYMDWAVDRSYLIPYPAAGHEALLQRLLYIKEQFGLDVVIPTLDSELPFFHKFQEELDNNGIATFLPTEEQFKLRGKDKLDIIAKQAGLTAPKQAAVVSYQELSDAITEIGLPVMIKGPLYHAHRAYNIEEAMAHFSTVVAQWGYPVIVQEYVTGEEMSVTGIGDGNGGCSGLVAMKKINTTQLGKVWTGVTVLHEGLLEATKRFVSQTNWQAGFEVECIVNGDTINLIEINPRFPAWVYFATGVGINLPQMLVNYSLGRKVTDKFEYAAGKLFVRYTGEQICDIEKFQDMVTLGECS